MNSQGKPRPAWVNILWAALVAAVVGAYAVTPSAPGALSLRESIEQWIAARGWASPAAVEAYDRLLLDTVMRLLPGLGLYLLFGLYWSIAAGERKADAVSEPAWSSLLHKTLVNLSVALTILPVPGLTQRLIPASEFGLGTGLAVEILGIGLAIAARRALGSNWSREVRLAEDHVLVRKGPYRRLRHPIYTGAIGVMAGLAIQSGLLGAWLGVAVMILAYWRKIAMEERLLRNGFGAEFEDYRRNSWALIPLLL